MDARRRPVGQFPGPRDVFPQRGGAQYAPARRDDLTVLPPAGPCMEYLGALGRRRLQAADGFLRRASFGIAGGCQHDADGGPRFPVRRVAVQAAGERIKAQRDQVAAQAQQDRLRLRVSQPAIELQQAWAAVAGDHQAGIEEPQVTAALAGHAAHCRQNDLLQNPAFQRRVRVGRRRTGAHAAGVRSPVAVVAGLVVAGSGQGQHVFPVGHGHETELRARQVFFHHDAPAGFPVPAAAEHVRGGGDGLFPLPGHHDPLAGSQAVRLDHHGQGRLPQVAGRRFRLLETAVLRGGDAMAPAEIFGEDLGTLQRGGGAAGPEAGQPLRLEGIGNACRQRRLGTDQRQVYARVAGEFQQRVRAVGGQGHVFHSRFRLRAGIARRYEYPLHPLRAGGLPRQGVLPAAAADDQDAQGAQLSGSDVACR